MTKYSLLLVSAVLSLVMCARFPEGISDELQQVHNHAIFPPVIEGNLFFANGSPAAGVNVRIRPRNTLADTNAGGSGIFSERVAADDSGIYKFDTTLDTGTYVIEADSGNDAVLIDSVTIKNKDSTVSLPADTLKPSGALKGVIKLSEGGDPRKVFVLVFGLDRFSKVNTDGTFRFQGLAEATYDLRLISSFDNYGVLDTLGIPVISADTTNIDTIEMPFTGIPTPKNVKISYDTLNHIATITWNNANMAYVKGYNVYRRNVDSNTVLVRITSSMITDTFYYDSSFTHGQTYEYRVCAVGVSDIEGLKSNSASFMASSFPITDFRQYRLCYGKYDSQAYSFNCVQLKTATIVSECYHLRLARPWRRLSSV
jgi:hypothetical protein